MDDYVSIFTLWGNWEKALDSFVQISVLILEYWILVLILAINDLRIILILIWLSPRIPNQTILNDFVHIHETGIIFIELVDPEIVDG